MTPAANKSYEAGVLSPRIRRRPAQDPWVVRYSPDAILAFLALFGLAFIPLLGSKGALLFLLAGLTLVVSQPGAALAALGQSWMFALMALWCLLSFLWSDHPQLALRYGIQLCLTVLIGAVIVRRLTPTTFVKIVFLTSSLQGIASLLVGRSRADGMGYLGIFASKNALAGAMAILIVVSLAILLDRHLPARWRVSALFGLLLGSVLMVMGNSSGALVSTFAIILILGIILFLQRLTPYVRLTVIVLTVVALALVTMLIVTRMDEFARQFLDFTGKDVTLTGRTDLWSVALQQIQMRPLLGVGYQSFWVQGDPLAEQLWAQFGIASRAGFNFHNTLLSNAVEIGLVGVTLQTVPLIMAVFYSLIWVLRSRSAASIFFSLLLFRTMILMWIEVIYFHQFGIEAIAIIAAFCYGRRFVHTSRIDAEMIRNGFRPFNRSSR